MLLSLELQDVVNIFLCLFFGAEQLAMVHHAVIHGLLINMWLGINNDETVHTIYLIKNK